MDRRATGLQPECEPASASGEGALTPGQRALAEATLRTVDFVLGRVDHGVARAEAARERAAAREKTLDGLRFDVRNCGPRITRMVEQAVEASQRLPGEAPAFCRAA